MSYRLNAQTEDPALAEALQSDSAFSQASYNNAVAGKIYNQAAAAPKTAGWQSDLTNAKSIRIVTNGTSGETTMTIDTAGGYTCYVAFAGDGVGTSPIEAVSGSSCFKTTTPMVS